LRDKGYYGFSREYVYFLTDTISEKLTASVGLGIKNPRDAGTDQSLPAFHPLYRIGNISIVTDFNTAEYLKDPGSYLSTSDTLKYQGTDLIFNDRLYMKPSLLESSVAFKSGSLFNQSLVDKTIESFSSLRNFKQIKVNFAPGAFISDSVQNLDCQILLSPVTKQSYDLSFEGTYSSGNIGVAGNLIYKHRNFLRGAENLEVKFKGAVEFLSDAVADFNTMVELGVDARLEVPRSWIPFTRNKAFTYGKPHSSVSLSYNYQQRPDFTRSIANAAYGYNWKGLLTRHQINIFELNYVNVTEMSETFYNIIKGTYIENSFRSHVVPAFNYTLTFTDQEINKENSFFYIRIRPEIAGNLFYGFSSLSGKDRPENGFEFFGTPYSQYAEADIDLRYQWVMSSANRMAFRFFTGAGYPYGNSDAMPFEKKYFSGGSTGIRAWQVRSLGPGSYVLPEDQVHLYPNQLGDVKLEANVEYRFDLFSVVKGAVFLDAGNIWAINNSDERPGAVFKASTFYKEIAVGTGFGIRADLSYFIGRLDLGIKLRDPGTPDGPKWIIGYRAYQWQDFVLNFGIGYPF
jgi:outer membrane protein assembly factor BamA